MERRRILVVDDEPAILVSTAALLAAFGHDVRRTGDHSAVPGIVRDWRPDVLLQDVRMPGLDLAVLLRRVREASSSIRVVLFSASIDLPEVAGSLNVNGWLEKPFLPTELLAAVRADHSAPHHATAASSTA